MTRHRTYSQRGRLSVSRVFAAVFMTTLICLGTPLSAVELPPESPLWESQSPPHEFQPNGEQSLRSANVRPDSLSEFNRVFSNVSSPTYSIHRPKKSCGVGLVICPGGGFRDVWIDREGHDLAILLKEHGVTSLVLKYRTRSEEELRKPNGWQNYQLAVQADGRQAIRILRQNAEDLGLQPDKIGVCGFSAGGHLAISCSLHPESKSLESRVSGMPSFAGLFYPGIPDDAAETIEQRMKPESQNSPICPMFIINARHDELTPVEKCIDFYSHLLEAGVDAELHVYGRGGHGFGLGVGRGESTTMWPAGFVAWLRDFNIIED
ncbi:alpha/beta hydrolase [Novipirellula herctigrandis]